MADFQQEMEIPASALVVIAHPDDAEFGCSGTIAKWAKAGCETHYLLLTSGNRGSEDVNADPEELARVREAEQVEAGKLLGLKSCNFLRYNDGELVATLQLRGQVVRYIRMFKPEVVITWDWLTRFYRMHPDHRVAGQVALEAAFPTAIMPLNYSEQIRDEGLSTHRVKKLLLFGTDLPDYVTDISSVLGLKFEAMKAHPSQFDFSSDFEERMRQRARDAALLVGGKFEYGEAFKLVEM
jgi:LmbE family N-acetylglucosaminyl deacetylase